MHDYKSLKELIIKNEKSLSYYQEVKRCTEKHIFFIENDLNFYGKMIKKYVTDKEKV